MNPIKILDKKGKMLKAGDILESGNGNKYIFISCGFLSPYIDDAFHTYDEFFYKFSYEEHTLFLYDATIVGKVSTEELVYLITLILNKFPKIVIYYSRYLKPTNKVINEIKNNEFFNHNTLK